MKQILWRLAVLLLVLACVFSGQTTLSFFSVPVPSLVPESSLPSQTAPSLEQEPVFREQPPFVKDTLEIYPSLSAPNRGVYGEDHILTYGSQNQGDTLPLATLGGVGKDHIGLGGTVTLYRYPALFCEFPAYSVSGEYTYRVQLSQDMVFEGQRWMCGSSAADAIALEYWDGSGWQTTEALTHHRFPAGQELFLAVHWNQTQQHIEAVRLLLNPPDASYDSSLVPEYWQEALKAGAVSINRAHAQAGGNVTSFLWYTDSHYSYGSAKAPYLLQFLQDHTPVGYTNNGGDVVNTYNGATYGSFTEEESLVHLKEWRNAYSSLKNHHSVIGNHDKDLPSLSSNAETYDWLFAPETTETTVWGGNFYYYVDNPLENTRYLYLDKGISKISDEETAFVIRALNTTPAGWHVVAVNHMWFNYYSTATPTVGEVPADCQKILDLFDAYNAREQGTLTMQSTPLTYDFSKGVGQVAFCMGGHIHVDYDFVTTGGIPVVITATDSYHLRGDYTRKQGTVTESAVYGVVADYKNATLHIVAVGRGKSRVLTLPGLPVTPTDTP
ncbi:MAG: metallophosphoesterase [Clostridia bacterium]|nr:metallophosphoesterase [Clostridia bacterium]